MAAHHRLRLRLRLLPLLQLLLATLLVALPKVAAAASAGFVPSSAPLGEGLLALGSARRRRRSVSSNSLSSLGYTSSSCLAVPFFVPPRNGTTAAAAAAIAAPPSTPPQPAAFFDAAYLQQSPPSQLFLPPPPRAAVAARPAKIEANAATATHPRQQAQVQVQPFHLYVDLDGVLCDFETGVRSVFPELSEAGSFRLQDLERHRMWKRIAARRGGSGFFRDLPWARGGRELWWSIEHLRPDILTGVPASLATSRAEKYAWCARELFPTTTTPSDARIGDERLGSSDDVEHVDMAGTFFRHARVNHRPSSSVLVASKAARTSLDRRRRPQRQRVITCWSSNKHHESRPGAVLIDDCLQLKEAWERKGGIFIRHQTGNAEDTLRQLVDLGILTELDLLQA